MCVGDHLIFFILPFELSYLVTKQFYLNGQHYYFSWATCCLRMTTLFVAFIRLICLKIACSIFTVILFEHIDAERATSWASGNEIEGYKW